MDPDLKKKKRRKRKKKGKIMDHHFSQPAGAVEFS